MVGLVSLANFSGGDVDLAMKIAKVGVSDTPLFSGIPKYVPSKKGQRFDGHSWKYEILPTGGTQDGFLGGSAPADANHFDYEQSKNHYQIFKDTYGIEGSMEDAQNIEGKNELSRQRALTFMKQRLDIEHALFRNGQAPVQENKGTTTAGRMGSLDHYCTVENTLTMTTAMNDDFLRKLMKFGGTRGVPVTHIYMNDLVKDQLDDIFKASVRRGSGEKVMEFANYTEIKNLAYSPSVKIVYTDKVPAGEMFGVNMQSLAYVYQRLTKDRTWDDGDDAVKGQVITEATLRVNNPFGVCKATGIVV